MFLLLLTVCAAIFGADCALITVEDRWPGGIVPYEVPTSQDVKYNGHNGLNSKFDENQVKSIMEAMKIIQAVTCVRFIPKRASDKAFIYFRQPRPAATRCVPDIPKIGYSRVAQPVVVAYPIIRNLLYSLGLGDEHNRPDRDDFIVVLWDNISKKKVFRFNIDNSTLTYNLPYDLNSVMHANVYYSSKNHRSHPLRYQSPKQSYRPKNINNIYLQSTTFMLNKIEHRKMTCSDVMKINLHYDCKSQLWREKKSKHLFNGTCPPIFTKPATGNESLYMVYADNEEIYKMSLYYVGDRKLVVHTKNKNTFVNVDCTNSRVYWYDKTAKQMAWAPLSDDYIETPSKTREFPTEVGGIALNVRNDWMYVTDISRKCIVHILLPTFFVAKEVMNTTWLPQGITITSGDSVDIQYMFWYECKEQFAEQWFKCRMWKSEIHKDSAEPKSSIIIEDETSLEILRYARIIHAAYGRIYTLDLSKIFSRDYNGKDMKVIAIPDKGATPDQITTYGNWIYFLARGDRPYSYFRIYRANRSDLNNSVTWVMEEKTKFAYGYSGIGVCQ